MKRTLTITSDPSNLCTLRRVACDFATSCGFVEKEVDLIVLGLDEACSNIIRHAYLSEPGYRIRLVCDKLSKSIRFRLRDFGKPCDPLIIQAKLRERSLGCVRPGGLGLHFIHAAFDEVHFLPKPEGTELVLIKRLKPLAPSLP
jgi:anti-sigma regulatory factor (Ser/Thr protein kinase)